MLIFEGYLAKMWRPQSSSKFDIPSDFPLDIFYTFCTMEVNNWQGPIKKKHRNPLLEDWNFSFKPQCVDLKSRELRVRKFFDTLTAPPPDDSANEAFGNGTRFFGRSGW